MRPKSLLLPVSCLAIAAFLLAPVESSRAFSKLGGSLDVDQRDVRLFDDFADGTANDNATPAAQFPGYTGAELAIWKAVVEWGSTLHGDGTGDPLGGNGLGSGGASFDAFWAGNAEGVGGTNDNIVSAIPSCGGGTLAFAETPISDGWRIRFCDDWVWDDGPGEVCSAFDIQGVMTHEYGHALGLGHSLVSSASMYPTSGECGASARSIAADDMAGVQCIYGVVSSTKPTIVATAASSGSLTILGSNFDPSDNEVWFTSASPTATGADPIVRVSGVGSSAGAIVVSIPAAAGPGDVIVRVPGTAPSSVSNAFPTDLVGSFGAPGPHPDLVLVTPATIEALIPGTSQTIMLSGAHLDLVTSVLLDGAPIAPARYTLVSAVVITLDMPQTSALGTHTLAVSDGTITDAFPVTVVVPASPRLQVGTGDALDPIDKDDGLDLIVGGAVGELHVVRFSPDVAPSLDRFLDLDPANPAAPLFHGGVFVISSSGWSSTHIGRLPDPGLPGRSWFAQSFVLGSHPRSTSNLQSFFLVP